MAEVRAARATHHLGARHAVADILTLFDLRRIEDLIEARPATPGIELRLRTKELLVAAYAPVGARVGGVPIRAGEGAFGALFLRDVELLWCQSFLPALPSTGFATTSPLVLATRDLNEVIAELCLHRTMGVSPTDSLNTTVSNSFTI